MAKRKKRRSFWDYKPIKNPFDDNAACEGRMFETYGDEVKFVDDMCKVNPRRVWTLLDNDDVIAGRHFVNRLGYFITACEWESENIGYRKP